MPVSCLVSVTVALDRAPPDWSRTVPSTSAFSNCAWSKPARRKPPNHRVILLNLVIRSCPLSDGTGRRFTGIYIGVTGGCHARPALSTTDQPTWRRLSDRDRVGGSLLRPSHTTVRTGPYTAVR